MSIDNTVRISESSPTAQHCQPAGVPGCLATGWLHPGQHLQRFCVLTLSELSCLLAFVQSMMPVTGGCLQRCVMSTASLTSWYWSSSSLCYWSEEWYGYSAIVHLTAFPGIGVHTAPFASLYLLLSSCFHFYPLCSSLQGIGKCTIGKDVVYSRGYSCVSADASHH